MMMICVESSACCLETDEQLRQQRLQLPAPSKATAATAAAAAHRALRLGGLPRAGCWVHLHLRYLLVVRLHDRVARGQVFAHGRKLAAGRCRCRWRCNGGLGAHAQHPGCMPQGAAQRHGAHGGQCRAAGEKLGVFACPNQCAMCSCSGFADGVRDGHFPVHVCSCSAACCEVPALCDQRHCDTALNPFRGPP